MDKVALDKYITTIPNDNFGNWVELVHEAYSEDFYDDAYYDRSDFENSDLETKWLNKLYDNHIFTDLDGNMQFVQFGTHTPESAAKVIERAYRLYKV